MFRSKFTNILDLNVLKIYLNIDMSLRICSRSNNLKKFNLKFYGDIIYCMKL